MSGLRHLGDRLSNRWRKSSPDETYLSYYDVRLSRADMDSIVRNEWITDNVISFWEEYINREYLARYPQASINLLDPAISQLLTNPAGDDVRGSVSAFPEGPFRGVTHIFIPINDNRDKRIADGTHWSLLLVSLIDGVAFHYDSLGDANLIHAERGSRNLEILLKRRINFMNMEDSPLQGNSYDCGIFVCLIIRHLLLKRLLAVDSQNKISMSMAGREINSAQGRQEIRRIINKLKDEDDRERKSRSVSRGNDGYDSSSSTVRGD